MHMEDLECDKIVEKQIVKVWFIRWQHGTVWLGFNNPMYIVIWIILALCFRSAAWHLNKLTISLIDTNNIYKYL